MSRARLAAACGVLLAMGLVVAGCSGPPTAPSFRGTYVEDPPRAEQLSLTDQYGEPFRLSDERGKIVVLFFGYVHCPDVCPVTLSTWAKVEEALGDDALEVRFVFVTVDPERDTRERLKEHLEIFSETFVGLTGPIDEMEATYEAFGIFRDKVPFTASAAGYVVDHSTRILVLDREGKLRVVLGFDAPAGEIVHDLRLLLKG
jgi:protein SCO1/2